MDLHCVEEKGDATSRDKQDAGNEERKAQSLPSIHHLLIPTISVWEPPEDIPDRTGSPIEVSRSEVWGFRRRSSSGADRTVLSDVPSLTCTSPYGDDESLSAEGMTLSPAEHGWYRRDEALIAACSPVLSPGSPGRGDTHLGTNATIKSLEPGNPNPSPTLPNLLSPIMHVNNLGNSAGYRYLSPPPKIHRIESTDSDVHHDDFFPTLDEMEDQTHSWESLQDADDSSTTTGSETSETTFDSGESMQSEASFACLDPRLPRKVLVDRLLDQFMRFFSGCRYSPHLRFAPGVVRQANGPTQEGAKGQNTVNSNHAHDSSQKTTGKRKRADDQDEGGNGEEEEDETPSRKRRKEQGCDGKGERNHLFACPFHQRTPQRYQNYRACVGPGWETVHRVKDHLYKRHRLPIHCVRCLEVFPSVDALDQHALSELRCSVSQRPPFDGLDHTKEARLRSRKRDCPPLSEEEKWYKMYQIVFPLDEQLPSPYYGRTERSSADAVVARYDAFLRQEMPALIRAEINHRLDVLLQPAEETLRAELPAIIHATQVTLFEQFRRSLGESPSRSDQNAQAEPNPNLAADPELHPNEAQTLNTTSVDQAEPDFDISEFMTETTDETEEELFPSGFNGIRVEMPPNWPWLSDSAYSSGPLESPDPFSIAQSVKMDPLPPFQIVTETSPDLNCSG